MRTLTDLTLSELNEAHERALDAMDWRAAEEVIAELRWRHQWARCCDGAIRAAAERPWDRGARKALLPGVVAANAALVAARVAAARGKAA